MPVPLSRNEARLAAMACRALAYRIELDIAEVKNPVVAEPKVKQREKLMALAQRFDEHAKRRG